MASNRVIDGLQAESFPTHLPSPSPSVASTATPSELPRPREHPLKPASQKEIAFINFVDNKMLNISRRYVKKFSSDANRYEGVGKGYESFKEVVQDLEAVFDVVWVSGTRKCNSAVNYHLPPFHANDQSKPAPSTLT